MYPESRQRMTYVHRLTAIWLCCTASFISRAAADTVVPLDDVTNNVAVRLSASSTSARVGTLQPGQHADLIGSVPNWHHVKLENGVFGFVSKRWTRVIASTPSPVPGQTSYTIDAVDVGTGLAVLVRGPDFTLVYDGGSNDDLGRGTDNRFLAYIKSVAPTLTTIDQLILSHPHRDHVELLPDLFGAYKVREVWDSGRVNDICGYRAFINAVHDDEGVHYHNALHDGGSQTFSFKAATCYGAALPAQDVQLSLSSRIDNLPVTLGQNATMTILHADGADYPSPNQNSLVVRLNLGDTRILLMGDAEAGGRQNPSTQPTPDSIEGQLLACCAADLMARVMVVGHHGSKTSSRRALLDAVNATFYIVSSGPTKYGTVVLPDQEVIDELTSRGQVFRTDVNDSSCALNAAKIGPDSDGKQGGCDNVQVTISESDQIQVAVLHNHD
jgi:competence protein ComEC